MSDGIGGQPVSIKADVVIVGGGVIGLTCAWRLAREGLAVTVLDANKPGRASPVAAGMLAPLAECSQPGPFLDLALAGLRRWPEFVLELIEVSGSQLGIYGAGLLRVAQTEAEAQALCMSFKWQQSLGLPLCPLDAREVRAAEPELSGEALAAIYSPEERVAEPQAVLSALACACARNNVDIHVADALSFSSNGSMITSLVTSERAYSAGKILLAAGAWSGLLAQLLPAALPVTPLRGQILSLNPLQHPPIRHTIYGSSGYLVPRPDGRIIVGATEEHAGFTAETTAEAISALRANAHSLIPVLHNASLHHASVGFRPASAEGLPILGRVPGWDNVFAAGGHGRNGILLSPITGDLMTSLLMNNIAVPAAFAATRFAEKT